MGERSWRFRIESSDDLEISGTHNVPHAQVMEVLAATLDATSSLFPWPSAKRSLRKFPGWNQPVSCACTESPGGGNS